MRTVIMSRSRLLACLAGGSYLVLMPPCEAAELPLGCFERTYSAQHMQNHPRQTVRRLTIRIEKSRYGSQQTDFGINVWVKGDRRVWRAGGQCEAAGGAWRCKPDTDGAPEVIFRVVERGLRALNHGSLQIFDDKTGPDLNTRNLYSPGDGAFLLTSKPRSLCGTGA